MEAVNEAVPGASEAGESSGARGRVREGEVSKRRPPNETDAKSTNKKLAQVCERKW